MFSFVDDGKCDDNAESAASHTEGATSFVQRKLQNQTTQIKSCQDAQPITC